MVTLENLKYKFEGAHVYEGIVFTSAFPKRKLEEARRFEFRSDDVLVATYPKSGTTWMQEIVWLLQNNVDITKCMSTPLEERFLFLELEDGGEDVVGQFASPRSFKSHLMQHLLNDTLEKHKPKVVVAMRNPKDVLVSQYHFYRMNKAYDLFPGSFDDFYELFKRHELEYGSWFEHVKGFWEQKDNQMYHFVKYEDLQKNPKDIIAGVAEFIGIDVTMENIKTIAEYTSFEKMKDNKMVNYEDDPYFDNSISKFMRKGQVGDWKNYFSPEQSEYVDELCKELEVLGLKFDME